MTLLQTEKAVREAEIEEIKVNKLPSKYNLALLGARPKRRTMFTGRQGHA
jgi:hypothetical protein